VKTRLINLAERLHGSLWFIPTLMVAGAFVLGLGMVGLDDDLKARGILKIPGVYGGGPEGARAVLATIAGSMITVTGVTFSITIVAMTLASTQFGPRLLAHFLRDRGNQFVLGAFLATFMYCLMVLRRVNGLEDSEFVPHLSVSLGIVFGVASLFVLIYFIHHSAQAIRAEYVIALVGHDLDCGIEKLYPRADGAPDDEEDEPAEPDGQPASIPSVRTGYIQAIDREGLLSLAAERDLVIRINYKAGRYVMHGCPLVGVWPARGADEFASSIQDAFIIGPQHTSEQDVEFCVHQLVEVALRALSPGINDPFTTINCVDRIGASLLLLAGRATPSHQHRDAKGKLRVICPFDTFSDITDAALNPIRQSAERNAAVLIRLLEVIAEITPHTRCAAQRLVLQRHVAMIARSAERGLPEEEDLNDVRERIERIDHSMAETSGKLGPGAPG
jgi:uncharacterized membrane protein